MCPAWTATLSRERAWGEHNSPGSGAAKALFAERRIMMQETVNLQAYYEAAYERLIARDIAFHAVDITGLNWTEIDMHADFETANRMFAPA